MRAMWWVQLWFCLPILNQADSLVEILHTEKGEHVLHTAGEVCVCGWVGACEWICGEGRGAGWDGEEREAMGFGGGLARHPPGQVHLRTRTHSLTSIPATAHY